MTSWADVVSPQTAALVASALRQVDLLSQAMPMAPSPAVVMRPFQLACPSMVRCVVLGGEPSPVDGAADGLAWSDPRPIGMASRATRAILSEWVADGGERMPDTGSLAAWAMHGVLLVNEVPTTSASRSEVSSMVWRDVMPAVVTDLLSWTASPVVIVAWGRPRLVTANAIVASLPEAARRRVHIIASTEPATIVPRMPTHGLDPFVGSRPFTHVNGMLSDDGAMPIDWSL